MSKQDNIIASVIFPLYDHRDQALICFNSWANTQTYPRDKYQVIVMSDGSEPVIEQAIRSQLFPQDQIIIISPIVSPAIEFYDQGVRQSKGEWVIFSEAHSLAEPTCIEKFLDYVQREQLDGACCRYISINLNNFAQMEEKLFAEMLLASSQAGHWNKLHLRGSILKRSAYLGSDGLRPQYGLFAEAHLASILHKKGYKLGYVDNAVVQHFNVTSVKRLTEAVSDYVKGECLYYRDFPEFFNEPYFTEPANWQDQGWLDKHVTYHLWVAIGKSLFQLSRGWFHRFRQWLALLPFIAVGPKWNYLKTKVKVFTSGWLCRLSTWYIPMLWNQYKYFHSTLLINQTQFQFLLQQYDPTIDLPTVLPIGKTLAISSMNKHSTWGFHPHETHQTILFRWTKPAAVM